MEPSFAALKFGVDAVKAGIAIWSRLPNLKRKIQVNTNDFEFAIAQHMQSNVDWINTIQMRDISRDLEQLYVDIHVYEGEERVSMGRTRSVPAISLIKPSNRSVLLGGPGAGKTTTLKKLAHYVLTCSPQSIHDNLQFPVIVRLRDLHKTETLSERLLELLGIKVDYDVPVSHFPQTHAERAEHAQLKATLNNIRIRALGEFLSHSRPLVLLDGLDEVHIDSIAGICVDIENIANLAGDSTFIVSCRHGAYASPMQNFASMSLNKFTNEQIELFAQKWFNDQNVSSAFMKCLSKKPYKELASIPLHATNFCDIYEADGDLPEEHVRVYSKIVDVRIRSWDRDRRIIRSSTAPSFGPDEKKKFLSHCCFELARIEQGVQFSVFRFESIYRALQKKFDLGSIPCRTILEEVEAHTGIIYLSKHETYEFVHKTIQEFLCGEYLSRMPIISEYRHFLRNMPDACALATALSNEPDSFIMCLDRALFVEGGGRADQDVHTSFWRQYFERLIAEKARFSGDRLCALGVCLPISRIYLWERDREARWKDESYTSSTAARAVYSQIPLIIKLPGIREGVLGLRQYFDEILSEKKLVDGKKWWKISTKRRIGASESFGSFKYPDILYVPDEIVSITK